MLKSMSDSVDLVFEDEEISEEEEQAVARSEEYFKHNEGIPIEEVLAEFASPLKTSREWIPHLCRVNLNSAVSAKSACGA